MNRFNISLPTAANLLKRRSSLFKPTIEDTKILKHSVTHFLELHQDKDTTITWQRLCPGYRIVDFQIDKIEETIDFLKMHYFCSNQSCASSSLYIDIDSVKRYQEFVMNVISNQNSFCAVEEGTGKLIGVALASVNNTFNDSTDESCEFTSKIDIFDVLEYEKALLYEANIYNYYNVEKYFCIHAVCVKPDSYNKGIGSALVRACLSKSRKIGYSVCIGIFPAGPTQTIARRFQFENLADLPWVNIRSSKIGPRLSYITHSIIENSCVSCMGIVMSIENDYNNVEDVRDNFDV